MTDPMTDTQAVHDLLTYAAFPVAAWLFVSLRSLRRVVELHHGYYGLALVILSRYLSEPWGCAVAAVALALAVEDAVVHAEQARTWRIGDRKLTGADDARIGYVHKVYAWVLRGFR